MFSLSLYQWVCQDCQTITKKVQVGLTSLGELCALWHCPTCHKAVACLIALDDVRGNIPPTPPEQSDVDFLKEFHITYPSEGERTGDPF